MKNVDIGICKQIENVGKPGVNWLLSGRKQLPESFIENPFKIIHGLLGYSKNKSIMDIMDKQ